MARHHQLPPGRRCRCLRLVDRVLCTIRALQANTTSACGGLLCRTMRRPCGPIQRRSSTSQGRPRPPAARAWPLLLRRRCRSTRARPLTHPRLPASSSSFLPYLLLSIRDLNTSISDLNTSISDVNTIVSDMNRWSSDMNCATQT